MPRRNHKEYSDEDLKRYMAVPARQKLRMLEKTNAFFQRMMPASSKKIWEELKKRGF
jgi:hypothetical protein